MKKLSELIKKPYEKIKGLSKTRKIAVGVILLGVLAAIVLLSVKVKDDSNYALLFNTEDANDAKTIVDLLKNDNVSMKIKGNAIYVPKDQADELRLEIAPQITSGSKGYELFDSQSSWGSTDKEMDIKTQRALQGELERTIKSYPQIKSVKVLLVLSSNSILVEDPQQASASVALILKDGYELTTKQVKAIVALVKGAVPNLAEKNVQITDQNLKNLTENLYSSDGTETTSSSDTQEQQTYKKKRETDMQASALSMLESVYGKGKVKLTVNADINFDAAQEKKKTYDGNNPVVSKQESQQTSGDGITSGSAQSPNDASQSTAKYPIVSSDSTTGSSSTSSTTNYNNSETDSTTIKAAGDVKRLTVSAVIDKILTAEEQTNVRDMIKDAVGYDEIRGDSITVVGMNFETSASSQAQSEADDAAKKQESSQKMKNYILIGAGIAGLLILLIVLKTLRKKSRKEQDSEEDVMEEVPEFDTVIGDDIEPKEPEIEFSHIDFEPKNDENSHVEKEIKKYATDKPDQVVDIIKSWLSDDEG